MTPQKVCRPQPSPTPRAARRAPRSRGVHRQARNLRHVRVSTAARARWTGTSVGLHLRRSRAARVRLQTAGRRHHRGVQTGGQARVLLTQMRGGGGASNIRRTAHGTRVTRGTRAHHRAVRHRLPGKTRRPKSGSAGEMRCTRALPSAGERTRRARASGARSGVHVPLRGQARRAATEPRARTSRPLQQRESRRGAAARTFSGCFRALMSLRASPSARASAPRVILRRALRWQR